MANSSFYMGRLLIAPPEIWHEGIGDPVTNLGGAAIPAPRQALRHQIDISTFAADGYIDTVASRLTIRRQMRSLLNNTPLKLQGYIYVIYSDDPEQNGWYIPDFGQMADGSASSGLATGYWKLQQVAWIQAGHKRTNRESRNIWMKDLRTGLAWRDTLKFVFSTDFTGLTALQLSTFPHGATQISSNVSGMVAAVNPLPAGRDGGVCQIYGAVAPAAGSPPTGAALLNQDLSTISFDRPDAAMNLSDVIVYDRRGNTGAVYKQTVLLDTPTSYWRLDETAGVVAADQMGSTALTYTGGPTLNQAGALIGGGDSDASVLLNGTTQYAIAPLTALKITTALTVEAWVNPTSTTGIRGVIGRYDGSGYSLFSNAGVPFFELNGTFISGGTLVVGQWAHLVGTWDGGTMRLYVNGVQVSSGAFTGPVVNAASAFTVGAVNGGASNWFAGSVDEAAVYSYTLTSLQVLNHYGTGIQQFGGVGNPQIYYGWEEVYGPDYPWSWNSATPLGQDCPVIENGLVRVRYDSATLVGFKVDVWNGSAYIEQGKMVFQRRGLTNTNVDTWIAASLIEYTPDRAVMQCVLASSSDLSSRERIIIIVQRGDVGVNFEYYPALEADGVTIADGAISWTVPPGDLNDSEFKSDTNAPPGTTGVIGGASTSAFVATAGTGSAFLTTAILGVANFTASENYVAMLRCITASATVGPFQHTLTVLQAANAECSARGNVVEGYVSATNGVRMFSQNHAGYLNTMINFSPTSVDQVMEAESMTLGTGTASTVDAGASGGLAATATRTTDANFHTSRATWPNSVTAKYRVFARVKVSANSASFYVKTGASTSTTISGVANTSYVWVDLGEILSNGTTLETHAWMSGGAGTVSVDRVESILVEDRTRGAAIFSGCRDLGAAVLYDSRQFGSVVAR